MFNPIITLLFVSVPGCICLGQSVPVDFRSVPRVETFDSRGSGFIVASTEQRFEVWTNGHVTGPVGSEATLRFMPDTPSEFTATGIVAWRRYGDGFDAAKIVGFHDGKLPSVPVAQPDADDGIVATSGFPNGNRGYSVLLTSKPELDFSHVKGYRPASISGQSGSAVVNANGEVTHVVTYRAGVGRNTFGGCLPISDWIEGDSRKEMSARLGTGPFVELK